jgi:crossover junction endodeoxyribonuclease RuvC
VVDAVSLVLGADPGLSGGLALIRRTGELLWAEAMPVIHNTVATIDVRQLGHLMTGHHEVFAFVERAQPMPRQGVSSAFNYGCLFGSLLTSLADLGIGYQLVQAAAWKRKAGISADKRESVDRVKQLYPTFPVKRSEDGIAEAILIARHGAGL